MDAILCQKLTKKFGDFTALDGLDLAVEKNRVFGFLGPNGAGKTTAVRMLTGLSQPTSGKAYVSGEEVTPRNLSLRSKIGFLPDVPAFYSWMTGREFMLFSGELHKLSPRENNLRADELLELVDLSEAGKRRVGGYSRGMKQRLGIAQALVNKPEVLFMDEPTSALDPMGRRDVLNLIERLSGDTTVFMSTHILSDVERVCDRVAIINEGKLITSASVEELKRKYSTSAFEIQFEEEPTPILTQLLKMPYIKTAEVRTEGEVRVLYVQASDLAKAKTEIPGVIAQSGLTLTHYELTTPSIEDVFIQLVGNGAKA
ncbi:MULTISPECIES: ATP-binding cassette domain-containing protein [Dehalococcoides]|uniref:ABC transporter ATP-binding protein n=2 Tax=Dehalococcoides mccartyi TaxID=61435 RepID=A0A142VC72_9CHLR|nr:MULTISPECIES: ATP-binding cassette domain-containing protein [Dehalococcoides]AGG07092.1 BerA-like protein [Dehalococcoides mccartyi DCMB5]AII61604.1 multidrug ABC transporter ATP-binding protein [Dehalococcoides mccartyi CG5]AMU87408.1 ABC transporter ATP-binding protein [Dehalococcoides mccartyi]AOW00050.1 ABC transporter, ATP-binding protein [Dehalococcoides mccartyi]AQW63009.1 multidrug ABC transporter ATP-binding protein [Dehalococcoides mccartyi]